MGIIDFADRLTAVGETLSTAVENETIDLIDLSALVTSITNELSFLVEEYGIDEEELEFETFDDDPSTARE